MVIVDTNGCEFGYELIMCLPYAYYKHKEGEQVVVLTSQKMEEWYCFLPSDQVYAKYKSREFNYPDGTELKDIHFDNFNPKYWAGAPNYTEYYKDFDMDLLGFSGNKRKLLDKPLMFISNKYTKEWLNPPINYLSLELLDALFNRFKEKYTIIYNRPRPTEVPQDRDQEHFPFGDWDLIANKHPEVVDLNNHVKGSYNRTQVILASKASKFISVQGGTSIISSCFGGENLIYAKKGVEITKNSYSWYNRFAGTQVSSFDNYEQLYNTADKLW